MISNKEKYLRLLLQQEYRSNGMSVKYSVILNELNKVTK